MVLAIYLLISVIVNTHLLVIIDTYNNNEYINNNIGKYYLLDKCGYHYTPKQYFTDNPWKRDDAATNSGSLRPYGYHYTPKQYLADTLWKRDREVSSFLFIGKKKKKKKSQLSRGGVGREVSSFSFHREKEETKLFNPKAEGNRHRN